MLPLYLLTGHPLSGCCPEDVLQWLDAEKDEAALMRRNGYADAGGWRQSAKRKIEKETRARTERWDAQQDRDEDMPHRPTAGQKKKNAHHKHTASPGGMGAK